MYSNIILKTDSYKVTHWPQLPPGTERVYSFFESRGGRYPSTTFFGLQYILLHHLVGPVITQEVIDEAADYLGAHFTNPDLMNREGWEYILHTHGGRLPISVKAVPEGTVVPTGNVLMTVENTDPRLPWLTNYLETVLSQVWYPTTVATQSRAMRSTLLHYLEESGDPGQIDFKLHDFGFRGSTSVESAGIGGAAHLVNFKGTDTMQALICARRYYGEPMAGYSLPAAEHSTIIPWGREHEKEAFANMLQAFPDGLVAVVSDSYDIFEACSKLWGRELKQRVLQREGTVVIRPDSGDPTVVLPRLLGILGDAFGFSCNQKGYRLLDPHVRLIQGDGIDPESLGRILQAVTESGWSADNLAFGSGGGLLQKVDRDTQRFAFKASHVQINGQGRDVRKDPVTDQSKRSKAGRLALVRTDEGDWQTVSQATAAGLELKDQLVEVFRNGELLVTQSLADIRSRALAG